MRCMVTGTFMQTLAKFITSVNRVSFTVAKWLVFAIAGLMLYEVIARYTLESPTSWAPELATLLFGPFFLFGGPYLLHIGGHVAVDILSSRATGHMLRILKIVGALMALVFGAILLWFSLPLAIQSYQYAETSYSGWNPVIWPMKAALPVAALLLALQALAEIIFALEARDAS